MIGMNYLPKAPPLPAADEARDAPLHACAGVGGSLGLHKRARDVPAAGAALAPYLDAAPAPCGRAAVHSLVFFSA